MKFIRGSFEDTKATSHRLLYLVWYGMKNRCYNPKAQRYRFYGAKGIRVCDEWRFDFYTFKEWALNNGYKQGLTIDRIKSFLDYKPSNCQWITQRENSIRAGKRFNVNGIFISLKEAAKLAKTDENTIRLRLRAGMTMEMAISYNGVKSYSGQVCEYRVI